MSGALKPYPKYKESGVEWLGLVPEGWEVVRLASISDVVNGYPFDSALFDSHGAYPLLRIRDLDSHMAAVRYSGAFVEEARVEPHDVLVAMDGEFAVGRWLGDEPALLNQRMCRLRCENPYTMRFVGNRSTNPGSVIRPPAVDFPPEEEQHDNGRTDGVLDGAGGALGS